MHNIKSIRKETDFFLKKLRHRNIDISLKDILDLDKKNRDLIQNKEKFEQEKKIISKKQDKSKFLRSKNISREIEQLDKSHIKIIRNDPQVFAKKLSDRNIEINLKKLLDLDAENRKLIQKKEKLEQEKKIISKKKDKTQFNRF